jgi:hypothetical protein
MKKKEIHQREDPNGPSGFLPGNGVDSLDIWDMISLIS